MSRYSHDVNLHNLKSPDLIGPEIIKLLRPQSVVDFGCGLGTFLNAFKRNGVNEVFGIDGPWTNRELLYKNIRPDEFREWDLEKEINLDKKYDLAVSLEVAEHLSEKSADVFVRNLVNAGKIVLFSAAIPNQGGQNHINEQWLSYWEEKFAKHNLVVYDVIRPLFWDQSEIFWWYRQNTLLFAPPGLQFASDVRQVPMRNIVHYELFNYKSRQYENVYKGKEKPSLYLKLFFRSVFGNDRWERMTRFLKPSSQNG